MGRFANSWSIAKASWSVLKADTELVALPAINAVVQLVLTGMVMGLIWFLAVEDGGDARTLSSSSSTAESTRTTATSREAGVTGKWGVTIASRPHTSTGGICSIRWSR